MKSWVRPWLKEKCVKVSKEKNASEEWISQEQKNYDECPNEALYYELGGELNTHFGVGTWGGDRDWFETLFGSVLADLDKEVFLELIKRQDVWYIFIPMPGAEVKRINAEQVAVIVSFNYDITFMHSDAAKGVIAHELAHVYLRHDEETGENDTDEDEADEPVKKWGFGEELKALRDYEKEEWQPKLIEGGE